VRRGESQGVSAPTSRILKVARTIADLAGSERAHIGAQHNRFRARRGGIERIGWNGGGSSSVGRRATM